MIEVKLTMDRAYLLADCLHNGKPIGPASDRWTQQELLELAGAALAAAIWLHPSSQLESRLHSEQQEFFDLHLDGDMEAAAATYAHFMAAPFLKQPWPRDVICMVRETKAAVRKYEFPEGEFDDDFDDESDPQ
jgi:hypothetical protein